MPKVDLVIFGGSGDLALRKLIPALYMAFRQGTLPTQTRIIAVGRMAIDSAQFVHMLTAKSQPFIAASAPDALLPELWRAYCALFQYCRIDVTQAADYAQLARALRPDGQRVYYLSTAPDLFTVICNGLAQQGLADSNSRLVLEKPLGHDLRSSQAINDAVARTFSEAQTFRIDHYLGKETVQNLMVLRFGNSIFEPLWRSTYIRSVQITVAEAVGVGSRAGFYDGTGAMRDMVQNHLLQLLCIVAMEPPVSLQADAIRDEKLKVLRSLRPMQAKAVAQHTVRGQYGAGTSTAALGYLQEERVPHGSRTETFVAIQAYIDNWRWANTPFFLRTGKRLQQQKSEIVIDFAPLPFSIFGGTGALGSENRLCIQLQPEEHITLQTMAKEPGSGMHMRPVELNLDLRSAMQGRRSDAYERLLLDVVHGRLTHFMRRDELEAAWRWIDPIIDQWRCMAPPMPYAAGSWGPAAASALIARAGCRWSEEHADHNNPQASASKTPPKSAALA